ncbi:sensor histidine kinase [Parvibacter caecicola]|nr:GAF domain-containing sensor histidine kinase [Parvibacter caecicola]
MRSYRLIDVRVPRRNLQAPNSPFSGLTNVEKQQLTQRAESAASNIELQLLSNVITGSVLRLSGTANRSFLFVHDWETDRMRLSSINGDARLPKGMTVEFAKGQGAPGIVWETHQLLIANGPQQVKEITETVPDVERILASGQTSSPWAILCCPIIVYREVVAAFLLEGSRENHPFTDEDAVFLERLCTSIASSISSAILTDELSFEKRRLESLVEQVFTAQENERMRIARDLHDDTGQTLALAAIRASSCLNLVSEDQDNLRKELLLLREDLKSAMQSVRDSVANLRPPILASHGLAACIESYVDDLRSKITLNLELEPIPVLPDIPAQQSTLVFRIIQEAVSNALRHSNAQHLTISLSLDKDALAISVEDDGCGFSVEETQKPGGKSFGLTGMMERAALLNGRCKIDSTPGLGTRVIAAIPLAQPIGAVHDLT